LRFFTGCGSVKVCNSRGTQYQRHRPTDELSITKWDAASPQKWAANLPQHRRAYLWRRVAEVQRLDPVSIGCKGLERVGALQGDKAKVSMLVRVLFIFASSVIPATQHLA
jgi:hypothetical protein